MKIVWNKNALSSLDKNLDHLKSNWTINDVENFLNIVDEKLNVLKDFPEMGTLCEFKPLLRMLVITKHITLFYEVDSEIIYLHLFWLNYNNPTDLQMLFS